MNPTKATLVVSCFAALLSGTSLSAAPSAALENRGQEKSNWCWNACTEMVLDWRSFNRSQTNIAAWAIGGVNEGNFLDTGTAGLGPYVDPETGRSFFRKGMRQVLEEFGPVSSVRLIRPLGWDEVRYELEAHRPFVYAIYWTDAIGNIYGGHVGVGKDFQEQGHLISIEDPWPMDDKPGPGNPGVTAIIPHEVITGTAGTTYSKLVFNTDSLNNRWAETLVLGRKADVVFVIDSTGSMIEEIGDVKAEAVVLLGELKAKFDDIRVAVLDYKDRGSYAGTNAYEIQQQFTADMDDARDALLRLSAGRGTGSFAEAVYSAVYDVASDTANDGTTSLGIWRTGDVSRNIILMGDAPGIKESPTGGENWPNGKSLADCVKLLADPKTGVQVQAVHVKGNPLVAEALSDFKALADASGGRVADNIEAADVSKVMKGIFGEIAVGRYPVVNARSMYPKFTFNVPGGGGGGTPKILKVAVEVERLDPKLKSWRSFARLNVPKTELKEFQSKTYFAPGTYRWRLAGINAKSAEVLPKKLSPVVTKSKVSAFVEEGYTEFERAVAAPGNVVKVSADLQKPNVGRQELQFLNDPSALSFAIQLEDVVSKKLTTIVVTRSKAKAVAGTAGATLSATVPCPANREFRWKIQGLNADRRSVDPTKWN